MKVQSPLRFALAAALFTVGIAATFTAAAQAGGTNPPLPVVNIYATDASASELGGGTNTGRFTVYRDGPTNAALNVFLNIGGTASNGVDYAVLGNYVTVPAGVRTANILVSPVDDALPEGNETVVLHLAQPPTLPPVNYAIGTHAEAAVTIADDDLPPPTNRPPEVYISSPPNNAMFPAPANIGICASAHDGDGYVATVEFFAGTTSLGVRTNCLPCASPMNPFCLYWTNVPVGEYNLTALATDDDGATRLSPPVHVSVKEPNAPPVVHITAPTNGSAFTAPVDIEIDATATDTDDNVVRVDFFAGDHFVGSDSGTNKAVYSVIWSNACPGLYGLTAKARDDRGAFGVSEPVRISVVGTNRPPETNRPPVVTIYAADPVAAEGTNFWRWCGTNHVGGTADRTNTAKFIVRRSGSTNAALNVGYLIGGTASNGVDYATIPDSVTIPAGERSARIVIVPVDDAIVEPIETVVLRLLPDTNAPAPFNVGWPSRAAAIIVDNDGTPPPIGTLPDHCFHVGAPGTNGGWVRIECSVDMTHWLPVCTNVVGDGGVHFVDPDADGSPTRFYRCVPETAPPPQ